MRVFIILIYHRETEEGATFPMVPSFLSHGISERAIHRRDSDTSEVQLPHYYNYPTIHNS